MLKASFWSYLQIKLFVQIKVENFLNFLSSNEKKVATNEQKVTTNEQKATTNEEKVTSNEEKLMSNEQRAKSFTSLKCQQKIQMSLWA